MDLNPLWLLILVAGSGIFQACGQAQLEQAAGSLREPCRRATAIGWASGAGRFGAIEIPATNI